MDDTKAEADALDFGNICHEALAAMCRHPEMRSSADAGRLRGFLLGVVDQIAKARFGLRPLATVRIQLEGVRQRLAKAAEVEAIERQAGWFPVGDMAEWKLGGSGGIEFNGVFVKGKIDRIDLHADGGRARIIDYKTSDRPVEPRDAHVQAVRSGSSHPEAALFSHGGKTFRWKDLQLPLYAVLAESDESLRRIVAGKKVEVGYFNLPKAVSQTGILLWPDVGEYLPYAKGCASDVLEKVKALEFLPPRDRIDPHSALDARLFPLEPRKCVHAKSE